jgi:hypothetical protein
MNTMIREIRSHNEPETVIEGAGVRLRRSFSPSRANPFDPFLLFDHFAFNDPIEGPIVGFPNHPHRGIETVTYMLKGSVRHRDSLGNVGVIGPGCVQWMSSGSGIMHEEMPQRGPDGLVNGFQLWVNLPAAYKMSRPRYQEIESDSIPTYSGNGTKVRVIAGRYQDKQGPVKGIAANPCYMDVTLESEAEFSLPVPESHTAVAYVFEGEAFFEDTRLSGIPIRSLHIIVFDKGDRIRVTAGRASQARFLVITGAPFGEPIVPYGPFVMNTEEEIRQAVTELRHGTFVKHGLSRKEDQQPVRPSNG